MHIRNKNNEDIYMSAEDLAETVKKERHADIGISKSEASYYLMCARSEEARARVNGQLFASPRIANRRVDAEEWCRDIISIIERVFLGPNKAPLSVYGAIAYRHRVLGINGYMPGRDVVIPIMSKILCDQYDIDHTEINKIGEFWPEGVQVDCGPLQNL